MGAAIHPNAVVDPSAELADGVQVGPGAVIGARVRIGAGTIIGAGAQVHGPTTLGENNHVHPMAAVGFDPQDLKFRGEEVFLEVGDENHFREFCTIHRGTGDGGGLTKIGSRNLFMAYTHVAHDCVVGDRTVFANAATLAGHVEVQDDATISAFSSVHQFCRVGRHAYVGGYSVLTMDALPFVKTVGQKPLCYGLNSIGLKRKGFEAEELKLLDRAYRLLVRSGLGATEALATIRDELGASAAAQQLADFVEASQRGVIKATPGRKGGRGGAGRGAATGGEGEAEA